MEIKKIIETNNYIQEQKRLLRELEKEKNSPVFNLDSFLKEHYRLIDIIRDSEARLEGYYKE